MSGCGCALGARTQWGMQFCRAGKMKWEIDESSYSKWKNRKKEFLLMTCFDILVKKRLLVEDEWGNSSYIIFPSSLFIFHRLYPFSYFSLSVLYSFLFSVSFISPFCQLLITCWSSPLSLSLSLSIFPLIEIINVWVSASKWWCVFF